MPSLQSGVVGIYKLNKITLKWLFVDYKNNYVYFLVNSVQ